MERVAGQVVRCVGWVKVVGGWCGVAWDVVVMAA